MINLSQYSKQKIEILFSESLVLKAAPKPQRLHGNVRSGKIAALLFFEPSTRTRFSFEAACARAGVHPLVLSGRTGTSLEKGETLADTIYNLNAMRPDLFVIRCNSTLNLLQISDQLQIPVINAGWGTAGHPTQALLDALTLFEKWKTLENKKILFLGDVKHSRVVNSHFELAKILNYEMGVCAPDDFLPVTGDQGKLTRFKTLSDGLDWADAVMALRVQKERHEGYEFNLQNYRDTYALDLKKLSGLKANAWIMHPGPINYGVELEHEVLTDPRSLIMVQVENGVFLREALIRNLLKD